MRENIFLRKNQNQNQLALLPYFQLHMIQTHGYMPVSWQSWGRDKVVSHCFVLVFFPFPFLFFPIAITLPPPKKKQKTQKTRYPFIQVDSVPSTSRVELRGMGLISKCCIWFRGDVVECSFFWLQEQSTKAAAGESSLFKALPHRGIWSSWNSLFYWSAFFVLLPFWLRQLTSGAEISFILRFLSDPVFLASLSSSH